MTEGRHSALSIEGFRKKPVTGPDPSAIAELSAGTEFAPREVEPSVEPGGEGATPPAVVAPRGATRPAEARRTRQPSAPEPVPFERPRRRAGRPRVGRDHPFTTRLRADTLQAIYDLADELSVPIAEVIERLVDQHAAAVRRQR